MDASLPYEPSVACAHCAKGVDPLRAPAVLALDEGFRYFCGQACRTHYRAQGSRRIPTPRIKSEPGLSPRGDELTRMLSAQDLAATRPEAPRTHAWPVVLAGAFALVGLLPVQFAPMLAALSLTALAGWVAVRASISREDSGVVAWLAGPTGVSLLALSGLFGEGSAVRLFAAALGVSALWTREWLAERAARARARPRACAPAKTCWSMLATWCRSMAWSPRAKRACSRIPPRASR